MHVLLCPQEAKTDLEFNDAPRHLYSAFIANGIGRQRKDDYFLYTSTSNFGSVFMRIMQEPNKLIWSVHAGKWS
ncbi:hypothetical protein CGCF415_v001182 [Colletotrichum fructicola]|nr:hypothetical protein CGCFRS4_v000568 [Colletotrichum fructicola]KAF4915903.1 hypothetical protein CGCF415_v001182 [Colletotrichum fructicola]KAF4942884.1 hypothetical protein CGCF245_v000028 [Colletotrichum fructicola]